MSGPAGAALETGPDAPLFRRDGDLFLPTAHTRGPWDPGAMHGGAPTALLANALDALAGEARLARLTFEFLGPVPLGPVRVAASVVKPGRNFRLLEATLSDTAGRPLLLARAVALAAGSLTGLPEAAALCAADAAAAGGPEAAAPSPFPASAGPDPEGMHRTGMDIRLARGAVGRPGPALAWMRLAHDLVDDEPPCPAARVCAAADFGNGLSHVVGFDTHVFVNTDLTVTLLREPVGEWVLMDCHTSIEPTGIGWAASVLYDRTGGLGHAHQTLFVRSR